MESGIKEDQNFYSRHPLAPSPDRPHLYSQPPDPTTPDRLDPSPFTSTSPEVPPKLSFLTAANLQAVTSNGFGTGLSEGSDPDEFYREFRSPQQLSNGYSDSPLDDMATKTSAQRHPSIPVARNNLRPSYRSASEPVNERAALGNSKAAPALNGTSQYGKPSVKDLLKRFDQNNEPSTPIARKPAPRLAAKDSPPTISGHARERVGYQARTTTSPQTNGTRPVVSTRYAGPVTAKSPTKSPASRPTHRTRFATEDKDSNKPLSISTHTTRPKNPGPGTNKQASKSMVNLSPTAPNPPSAPPTRKPLFGEILPLREAPELGYGISRATRRTSDSGLHPPASLRDQSNRDISPSSPTAWYLGVTPALEDADPNKARNISLSHNRNHSDSADNSVNTRISVDPTPFITSTPNAQMHEAARSASRLPLSSNKPSDRSGSSSPTSPISNTSITKKSHVTARRKPDQSPWNSAAAGRAVTPISRNTTPGSAASPPRQSPRQSPRRAKVPEKLNTNPSSLKAYISAPPPKQSPPLRSSRPRLPVSSASASSPRQNYTDASGSPQHVRSTVKATRTGGTNEPRPRKIVDNGPVDFVARRERIQRAYTKSIQESEQREIRAANLRRLQERQARAAEEKEEREREAGPPEEPAISESIPESTNSPAKPLQITTSFFLQEENVPAADQDSPTLGMPGGFVDDEEPASAVTDATATTEFDNEQQTEAPQLSRMPITQPSGSTMTSSIFQWNDLSVDQASFGMVHLLNLTPNSANASGHASPIEEHQPEHTPTNDLFEEDPSIPGAFKHDSVEYNQPIFATTVTTPSPEYAPPPQSRSFSNHISSTASDDAQQLDTSQIHPPPRILLHPESETTDANNLSGPHTNQLPLGTKDILEYLRSPSTEPNYESSDGYGGMNNSEPDSYEAYEQVQDGRSPSQNHISSYRSSWTNESIGTTGSSGQGDYVSSPPVRATSEPEQKPTSAPGIYSPPTKLSSQISTDPSTETPGLADPSSHMDVASSTDDGFGITFADPAPVPLWPNYSPPPPPDPPQQDHESSALPARSPPPSLYNKRPASTLYQSSQNDTGRNTESPRASDDTYSARASVYTPRSSTQISLEGSTANQSFDSKEASVEPTEEDKKAIEKLKKRLFQRRMLIKELIDTESVYLKDMNVVEEIYKGTAEACPNMDTNDIKAIFRNSDEIVAFSTMFLDELKSAGSSVYSTRSQRKSKAVLGATMTTSPAPEERFSVAATLTDETDDQRDRRTFIGANFGKHLKRMQTIYTDFLKNSEQASSKLTVLQSDSAVKVWLSECNLVAKDLTAAWDLDALLVKPVQRITRYQLLLAQIFEHTSEDHPDWQALRITVEELAMLLKNIDDLKKRIQMVGKIVGRKRKESDVRSGIAKAFGRRTDKLQAPNISRPHDDEVYLKLHEKFGDDYLRLQVVLRDVEYYTRETTTYVRKFLEHLSSIELIMRIGASSYPELESKWVRFNISMRDMGTVALEDHLSSVRSKVIEPFEHVIQAYGPPGLAMKKRNKRRLDYEKYLSMKAQGKKIDEKLTELVDQYVALNETLKLELPKLSSLTESLGNVCLVQFINIQTMWYGIWQDKVRTVLENNQVPKDIADIVNMFTRDFKYAEARAQELGIVNGNFLTVAPKGRTSQSTQSTEAKGRPSNLSSRSRGMSFNSDKSPSLPTPDFEKNRHSGQFTFSPVVSTTPGVSQFGYQTHSHSNGHSRNGSLTPVTPDPSSAFGSRSHTSNLPRPSTGRSATSDTGTTRPSNEYSTQYRRESGSTSTSGYRHVDGPPPTTRPFSGIFHSAMPLPDGPEDSQRSSRASSRDRNVSGGYNVLYLAASLFEFNISATKSEAGYPYLTYQAGEIFDVIGEKGELWLAKNQDDLSNQVGWIWSKHFARLAAD